jgi:predicted ribosomally synthesized peptide with SipW-like signal peptide
MRRKESDKMKMDKGAIFASMAIIALASVLVGAGTMAYFSSTRKAGIYVTAGSMDLQLSKDGTSWYNSLSFDFPSGWAPGDNYTVLVWLRNVGSSGSRTVWVYGADLYDPNGLSDVTYITDVAYTDSNAYGGGAWGAGGKYWIHPAGGTFYAGYWAGHPLFGDGSSPLTLREFTGSNPDAWNYMRFYWGKWFEKDYLEANGGSVQGVQLTFHFAEGAGDQYQNKACSFNIVFTATDEMGYPIVWP